MTGRTKRARLTDLPDAARATGRPVCYHGGDWRLSVAPDARLKGLDELRKLKGSDFEVVQATGPDEGPRAKKE
jgi:hypothetical protein